MIFNESYVEKWKLNAKDRFKNFEAVLTKMSDVELLDWRDKNGSSAYRIRFLFDEKAQTMTVSGDLGYAVFKFTEPSTFDRISRYSSLPYFFEKLMCSTDTYKYLDDRDEFYSELILAADFVTPNDDDEGYSNEDFRELFEDLWDAFGNNGIELDNDLYDRLNHWTAYRGDSDRK